MKVYILVRHYLEDYSHPFAEPDRLQEIQGVYASPKDVNTAKERGEERAKLPQYARLQERYQVLSKDVLGLFPQDTVIMRRVGLPD